MPQIQTLLELVVAATEGDDAECALNALLHFNSSATKALQPVQMDEGSIVAVLGTAARTANAALAREAWKLLKITVGSAKVAPNPAAYMALVHALSSSQQFDAVFSTLDEMQRLFGTPQNAEELEILSPFSSLRPLVLSLTQLGPAGLDGVSLLLFLSFVYAC